MNKPKPRVLNRLCVNTTGFRFKKTHHLVIELHILLIFYACAISYFI